MAGPFDSDYFGSPYLSGYLGADNAPGAISAAISGAASVAAELSSVAQPSAVVAGGRAKKRRRVLSWPQLKAQPARPAYMKAATGGVSLVSGVPTATAVAAAGLVGAASVSAAGEAVADYSRETEFWLMAA